MGKVAFVVGDDVSTDVIYPGRYMATVLPTETPQFAFANDPALNSKLNAKLVPPGSVLVGGKVVNRTSGKSWAVVPLPPARQAIIDAGGLIAFTRKRMLEAQAKG
jgi:3-isopropylmalate dehydratase small subunit